MTLKLDLLPIEVTTGDNIEWSGQVVTVEHVKRGERGGRWFTISPVDLAGQRHTFDVHYSGREVVWVVKV